MVCTYMGRYFIPLRPLNDQACPASTVRFEFVEFYASHFGTRYHHCYIYVKFNLCNYYYKN